jgi:predicted deacylase
MFQELDPAELCGEVTIVTICSVQAFEQRSVFVCPEDGKNPNRAFPGSLTGSYSDALAYYIFHDFIANADYYIDLHGGDMVEVLDPFAIYRGGENNETERLSRELVEYYGLPNIVMTTSGGAWDDSGTAYANAAMAGVPGTIVEVGGVGQLDQSSVDMHLKGLRNVLRYVKCLKGIAVKPPNQQFYRDFLWVFSPAAGIFYRDVEIGDMLRKGQKIGQVEDYFGNKLAEVISPSDGKMLFLTTSPAIKDKGLILGLGVL